MREISGNGLCIPLNFERMFASSLLMRRSSSSFARAFRMSEMNVVSPRIEDMLLSEENRDAGPPLPPPALRIVVTRFSVGKCRRGGNGAIRGREGATQGQGWA
jgi:hypothetical protein